MSLLDKLLDAAEQDGGLVLSSDDVLEILVWINDGEIDLDHEDLGEFRTLEDKPNR